MKRHKRVRILDKVKTARDWEFAVAVDGFTFTVKLGDQYYQELTAGRVTPEQLVEASFRFLLDREKPEQIETDFHLGRIESYFPSFRQELPKYL